MDNKEQLIENIPDECIIVLTDEERDIIKAVIDDLPPLNIHQMDNDDLFSHLEIAKRDIPREFASKLIGFRRNPNNYGTLLLRNLPTDSHLPLTPKGGRASSDKTSFISEYNLLLVLMHYGEPIAYADRKGGDIIHNICPIKGSEEVQGNAGSVLFEFHTESTFHPYKTDYFGLFCLRSDHDQVAQTFTASIRNALPKVPSGIIPFLREALYRSSGHLAPLYQREDAATVYTPLAPILSNDILDPDLCIDFYNMEAITPDAQMALDILKAALTKVTIGAKLLPGDLLIIDNHMVVHGRTAFKPRYDGKDRWLQRLYTIQDFHKSKSHRPHGSHVCMPFNEFTVKLPDYPK